MPDEQIETVAREVIGAAIEVHRTLGPGFVENIYETALALELTERGIPFARQVKIDVFYKGTPIGQSRIDLLVGRVLIVELKAVDALLPVHKAQVLSYLKAIKQPLGLLLNFKGETMRGGIQRVILSQ